MPIECPLCNGNHILDNATRCGLCDGGVRRFIRVRDVSRNEAARGWLATTERGAIWMAIRVEVGGGYQFMAAMKLPLERMTTDDGIHRVFAELSARCANRLGQLVRQVEGDAERKAGQAVH